MGDRETEGDAECVLSNRRRRQVIEQLRSHGTMTIRDLAEQIAVTDQGVPLVDLCVEAVEEVEIALHHVHVPKLQQAGFVEYNQRRKLVAATAEGHAVRTESTPEFPEFHPPEQGNCVSVDLRLETIESLHEAMRADERLRERMSYDEAVATLLEGRSAPTEATDDDDAESIAEEGGEQTR